jgi:ATP-dependent Clp protease ATP-binding subunit ClpA
VFERFTPGARQVVVLAQQAARQLQHGYIGTEHLLLGLLAEGEGLGAQVLQEAGVDGDGIRTAVVQTIGSCSDVDPGEAAALRSIGIDLGAVREAVEASFGPGALERARTSRQRLRRRRRVVSGHIPFTPRAKKVLELSLREALRLHHNEIRTEHVLLGLLREGQGLAALLLVARGLSLDELRRRVLERLGNAA